MNVKTPKLKAVTQLELEGRGLERQLEVGGRDLIHNITFQIKFDLIFSYLISIPMIYIAPL